MALLIRLILLLLLAVPFSADAAFFHGHGGGSVAPPTTPVIASIVFAPASGFFNAGQVITMQMTFSQAVTIAGGSFPTTTATIGLNSGATTAKCPTSLTGVLTWTCTYTVAAGNTAANLAMNASAITLNSSTVVGTSGGGNANLTFANNFASSGIVIDTTAPTVNSVVASGVGITAGAGTVTQQEPIILQVAFSSPVTMTGSPPTLSLNNGGVAACAVAPAANPCVAGTFSSNYNFTYTTVTGQNTPTLAVTAMNNNSFKDQATNAFGGTVPALSGNVAINIGGVVACATNFYATTGAAGGGNGSIGSPWNSITQVNNFRTFGANACVNMNSSGGAFIQSLTIGPNIASGLTSANPVVFQPAPGQAAWTLQASDTGQFSAAIYAPGPNGGWTVTGAVLRQNPSTSYMGVYVSGMNPGAKITNSNISIFTGGFVGGPVAGDISVAGGAGGTNSQPFVISNNTLGGTSYSNVDFGGFGLGGQNTIASGNIVGFSRGSAGICCGNPGPSNFITNNLLHDVTENPNDCGPAGDGTGSTGQLQTDGSLATQYISRNEMYNTMLNLTSTGTPPNGSGCDGTGVDLDGGSGPTVVEYNFGHHNAGASFYSCIGCFDAGSPWGPSVFRYNISENDGFRTWWATPTGGGIAVNNNSCARGCTVYVYGNTVLQNTPGGNGSSFGFAALTLSGAVASSSVFTNNLFAYTSGNVAIACDNSFTVGDGNLHGTWRNNNFWNMSNGTGGVALPASAWGCGSSGTITPAAWDALVNASGGSASGSVGVNPGLTGPVPTQPPSNAQNSSATGSASIPSSGPLVNPPGYALAPGSALLTAGTNPYGISGVPLCSNSTTVNGLVAVPCADFYGVATPTTSVGGTWSIGASQGAALLATNAVVSGGVLANGQGELLQGTQYTVCIVWNSAVTVTGTPHLILSDGATLNYSSGSSPCSGSGSAFLYTPGAETTGVLSISSLNLNGGTIQNGSTPANLTMPQFSGAISVNFVANTYALGFVNESPVSSGGAFFNTNTVTGGGWDNVNSTSGFAFPVTPLPNVNGGDAVALINSAVNFPWVSNQSVQGTIHIVGGPATTSYTYVSLLLDATMSSGSITGYKAGCSVSTLAPGANIFKWSGPVGAQTVLPGNADGSVVCADGDILKFTNVNHTLTLYLNHNNTGFVVIAGPVVDTDYGAGTAGMTFYDAPGSGAAFGSGFGLSSWTASSPFATGGGGSGLLISPLDAIGGSFQTAACYSFRACSAAAITAGRNAYQLTRASDSTSTNVGLLSDGTANTAAATSFCGGTTCTISTWYDQSGNGNSQTVQPSPSILTLPVWTANCIGSPATVPCALLSGINDLGGDRGWANTTFNKVSTQPYSASYVGQFNIEGCCSSTNNQYVFGTSIAAEGRLSGMGTAVGGHVMISDSYSTSDPEPDANMFLGTPTPANDSLWHTVQNVMNGSASGIYYDGTNFPGSITAVDGLQSQIQVGSTKDFGYIDYGHVAELIIFNSTALTTAQENNLCANQRVWANTGGTCTPTGVASCPDNDGSSLASAGTPQFPALLVGYSATINGTKGLGCKVAGVDYHVGPAAGTTFVVPTSGNIPAGCSKSGNIVTCSGSGIRFANFDMTGLELDMSGPNATITNNKFAVTSPGCLAPIRFTPQGTYNITYNSDDGGGGGACSGLAGGLSADIFNSATPANGSVTNFQYNYQSNINEDGVNYTGSSTGGVIVHHDFNVVCGQGWVGHPDGIQLTSGNLINSDTLHNTYIKGTAGCGGLNGGTQPYHIEAQLTSAVSNWHESFNTMVTPGTCNGGTSYPTGCPINFDIACKNDNGSIGVDSNDGFVAVGNYIDWTGAIAPFVNGACTNTTWGSPQANYDMVTGTTLTTSP